MLKAMVVKDNVAEMQLSNAVSIEVGAATIANNRGYSFGAVVCDEIAFWRTDDLAANPDSDILSSVMPGLATIDGSMLLVASSPYARRGGAIRRMAAQLGHQRSAAGLARRLHWEMNPSISQAFIDKEYEKDAVSAASEFGAEWRSDLEAFIDLDVVKSCIRTDLKVRPPSAGLTGTSPLSTPPVAFKIVIASASPTPTGTEWSSSIACWSAKRRFRRKR